MGLYSSSSSSSMYGSGGYSAGSMYNRPLLGGAAAGGAAYGAPGMPPPGLGPMPVPAPPTAWQAALVALGGVAHSLGRLSFMVDENAHAVHFLVSSLLQLLDRAGSLYGLVARFVLRVIFRGKRAPKALPPPQTALAGLLSPKATAAVGGAAAAWRAPALPPPGSGSALDVGGGGGSSHWESLWT